MDPPTDLDRLVRAGCGLGLARHDSALHDQRQRDVAILTFLVTLSGVSLLGKGSAFWGVVAGALALLLQHWRGSWR